MSTPALKIAASIETPNSPGEEPASRPYPLRIVASDVARRAEEILGELTAAYAPQSAVQAAAVAELALARTRQYDLEAAHDALRAEAVAHATDAADRFARDRFVRDRESWLADPALNLPILASTLLGTELLARIWADFAASLEPGSPGPTDEQKRLAAAALGSPWQVDKVRGDGLWLWSRLVRIAKEPGFEASHWSKRSDSPDSTPERARWIASLAPDPATARAELAERARAEQARWTNMARFLHDREKPANSLRGAFQEAPIVIETGLDKRLRQNARELSAARNRADRLERRLDSLMKPLRTGRPKTAGNDPNQLPPPPASPTPSRHPASVLENPACEMTATNPHLRDFDEPVVEGETTVPSDPEPANVLQPMTGDVTGGEDTSEEPVDAGLVSGEQGDFVDSKAMARTLESLKKRLHQFRYLDWRDPNAISPEDVEILRKVRELPRSADRNELIRQVFGSEKTLKRIWRSYLSWSGRHEPAGAATIGT